MANGAGCVHGGVSSVGGRRGIGGIGGVGGCYAYEQQGGGGDNGNVHRKADVSALERK